MKALVYAAVLAVAAHGAMAQKPMGPEAETAMASIVDATAQAADAATNDMQRNEVRRKRGHDLCAPGGVAGQAAKGIVKDWTGKAEIIDAIADGRGILAVRVSPRIRLMTTNNEFSEKIGPHQTLIPNGSAVYNAAIAMRVGQKVVFSGNFFPSGPDCFQETSLTQFGLLGNPDYLFRFTALLSAE